MARYHYVATIGTRELRWYGGDDTQAKRKVARWIRMFWARYRANKHARYPGSMADATDNGWYGPPECQIGRIRLKPADIIPCENYTIIDRFELSPEPIAEFMRIARP